MNNPLVSIIIPCYYSYEHLQACLESLRKQSYNHFEVIVVNSSPESETARVVSNYPEVCFIQSEVQLYPHAAHNRGLELAKGEMFLFIDPDCVAEPDWVEALVRAAERGADLVAGSMDLAEKSWSELGYHLTKFHWILPGRRGGAVWIAPTSNCLYRREILKKTGSFNGDVFCDDAVMTWRARKYGFRLLFEPYAIVLHRHSCPFLRFLKMRYRRGCEFGYYRMKFENWSRCKALCYCLLSPLLVLLVILRAGRDTLAAGWFLKFLITLPIQLPAQSCWVAGEGRAYLEAVLGLRHGQIHSDR